MNLEDIRALQAGRELDCLIIQHVYKKPLWDERPNWYLLEGTPTSSVREYAKVPRFSKDISAAFEILDMFKVYEIYKYLEGVKVVVLRTGQRGVAKADSVPEAICKAALLAVMDL